MSKLSVMLVDLDEKYLMPIELKFIEELEDEIDIMVISDEDYLGQYFSSPKKIDVLLISEDLYSDEFLKHDIGNTFILTEEEVEDVYGGSNIHKIYKHTSVKKLYLEVMSKGASKSIKSVSNNEETRVLMLYSPCGGSGKTTVGTGIAAALMAMNKKVLYISTDSLQSFYFAQEEKYCKAGFDRLMISRDDRILDTLSDVVDNNSFDYLLPFRQSLSSLNVNLTDYKFLIDKIKETRIYDYIIVDSSTELTAEKSMLMNYSDKVMIVTGQRREDRLKLNSLFFNVDCSDESKYIFICNKYIENKENYLIKDEILNRCNITEYIEEFEEDKVNLQFLARNVHFNKLAYMLT
ncbi:AAA family ATPase [Clostridium sp. SHJSY1]|uniref:AAA family ATPase n=1 Tax=Clostridium sp. SHJSY1 TaxID=2942483 RepID=UPI0028741909|nr:AAA family ATPase [Clostridium sp. SHJSY1]MDS0524365.1 AAA family ATPase [Clostridium sp. SHJSY1]